MKINQKAGRVLSVVVPTDGVIKEDSDTKTNIAEDGDIKRREMSDEKC